MDGDPKIMLSYLLLKIDAINKNNDIINFKKYNYEENFIGSNSCFGNYELLTE